MPCEWIFSGFLFLKIEASIDASIDAFKVSTWVLTFCPSPREQALTGGCYVTKKIHQYTSILMYERISEMA